VKEGEGLLNDILKILPEGIMIFDAEGNNDVKFANKSSLDILFNETDEFLN
jgi:hypothetical protein